MKVILLAAGESNRIKPLADKNFLQFLGKNLIEHQVERIQKAGFTDIILVGGAHNLQKLTEIFSANNSVTVIEQENLSLGMAGAVMSASTHCQPEEEIVVISSNDILDISAYSLILEAVRSQSADGYLLGYEVTDYFPGGYLVVNEENKISSIVEKPQPGTEPSNLINLVVHYHRNISVLVNALNEAKSNNDDVYEVALDVEFKNGKHYISIPYSGNWQAIKYPWHIHDAWKYFFTEAEKHIHESAQIHETAVINGDVIIDEGAKVFPHAVINGPAYIGKNAVVANNALVRESHLGNRCVAGFTTEIARSYLLADVWTHSNYIGDSVIGENVSFGAGAITANLRLDEGPISVTIKDQKVDTQSNKVGIICGNDVRIGVNTSMMPGIKIGKNSVITSGLTIEQDIPDNSFLKGTYDISIRENKISIADFNREKLLKKLNK